MYTAPIDKTAFQTVIFGTMCWFIYTFLYKPVVYGTEPLTFTTDEFIRIIQTGVNDFYNERSIENQLLNTFTDDLCKSIACLEGNPSLVEPSLVKSIDDIDAATTLISLNYTRF